VATTLSNREFETALPDRFITLSVRAARFSPTNRRPWLGCRPRIPPLRGRTPLEATATQEGFQEADEVLTRIEYGVLG